MCDLKDLKRLRLREPNLLKSHAWKGQCQDPNLGLLLLSPISLTGV